MNSQASKKIKKIDVHTHIIPEHWPNWNEVFGYDGWLTIRHEGGGVCAFSRGLTLVQTAKSRREPVQGGRGQLLVPRKEAAGVRLGRRHHSGSRSQLPQRRVQVISTVPGIGFNYGAPAEDALTVARFLNDHTSQVVRAEPAGRFIGTADFASAVTVQGLGTVPLQAPNLAIAELERCVLELGLAGVQIGSHFLDQGLDSPDLEPFWSVSRRQVAFSHAAASRGPGLCSVCAPVEHV